VSSATGKPDADSLFNAHLARDFPRVARNIVTATRETVCRLIFIRSMDVYDEVLGQKYSSVLDPDRDVAQIIEASDRDYTILRPAWFTHADEIDYETTQTGEPFKGGVVSCKSVAALVVMLATTPGIEVRRSLGVSRPERPQHGVTRRGNRATRTR
jgi:hypothetical protein